MLLTYFSISGYAYSDKLLALESQTPNKNTSIPTALQVISTPLRYEVWQSYLVNHHDQRFVQYILRGIKDGFRIGFNSKSTILKTCYSNLLSAMDHPQVVTSYITDELHDNRLLLVGSPTMAKKLGVHCSPFGVIPKKNKPGKWRLILDLSSPEHHSVNDGIDKDLCSLSYTSVDEVVASVVSFGRGTMLAKMDIKQAYRNIPVHPNDRMYLGMQWDGSVYIDAVLPFGLRSAPLIFSAVADALLWIMQKKGAGVVFHYLDDFITVGAPASNECSQNIAIMNDACRETGMPIEVDKCEGPATTLTFLGIELDTVALELRLPLSKLEQLKSTLSLWRGRKACTKRELLSLIGLLSHACKVIRAGRTFLRRLIDLSMVTKRLDHHIRLNLSARSDIEWWWQFASPWNGISMLVTQLKENPAIVCTTDASGSWGCGAWYGQYCFQLQWVVPINSYNITVKELLPIVLAAAVWGSHWKGLTVKIRCDNAAVVAMINRGTSHEPEAMHLLRCLSFISAKFQLLLYASHLAGAKNTLADDLSRNNASNFLSSHTQANPTPTHIPEELLDVLVIIKPDWMSPHWTKLWTTTLNKV